MVKFSLEDKSTIIGLAAICLREYMKKITIYHNPQCSKSRKALEILQSYKDIDLFIVEYLKTLLDLEQLVKLRSYFSLNDFVRSDEKTFRELELSLDDERKILQAMLKEPILMQRPIVTCDNRAIIARPSEKVLELIN